MTFECAAGVAEDCVGSDLFDPPFRDPDGATICGPCARELNLPDQLNQRDSYKPG